MTFAGHARVLAGASGVSYQNDVLMFKPEFPGSLLLVECKHRQEGSLIPKEDIMIFNSRAIDIYIGFLQRGIRRSIFRVFVSSVPLAKDAFRYCLTYGILVIQPCFDTREYPRWVGCRPPIQVIAYELEKTEMRKSSFRRQLLAKASRMEKNAFREISAVRVPELQNGFELERSYFDLLYMGEAFLERGWLS